jgi:hypothetical protein
VTNNIRGRRRIKVKFNHPLFNITYLRKCVEKRKYPDKTKIKIDLFNEALLVKNNTRIVNMAQAVHPANCKIQYARCFEILISTV